MSLPRAPKSRVSFFLRKPFPGQFSVESYFARVSEDLVRLDTDVRSVVSDFHSKGLFSRLQIMRQARNTKRKSNEILHIAGDVTFAGIWAKRPFTMTILDLEFVRRASGWRQSLLRWLWIEWPCRRADKISVISQETKRSLIEFCPSIDPEKIVPIPVSVSDSFEAIERAFPEQAFNILQIGTKPNKNVPRLIQALEGMNCKLTVIGARTPAIDAALKYSSVHTEFLQRLSQKEIVSAYQSCDVVAFVSLEEGFGMPIVEAQQTGRPVITSNCSAMPETAGAGAHLVDPYDVADIRRGIEKVAGDREYREELIRRGYENAARFERIEIARRFLEMFESVETRYT